MTTDGGSLRPDEDPDLWRLVERYVIPGRRYLKLLGGNFLHLPDEERLEFTSRLRNDSEEISDTELERLLSSEWRSQLTASWLIAASKRVQFRDRVAHLLLASQLVYAGQGFCVALASIGGSESARRLEEYLDAWLPTDSRFDQGWAMGALNVIDERMGSARSARFLGIGGLWQEWTKDSRSIDENQFQKIRDLLAAIEA